MARPKSLTTMSVDLLIKMRDDITAALASKANALKKKLAAMGADYREVGRIAVYGRKSLAGRKVAPKYRDPETKMTWAGRGAKPVWMCEAIKAGKKAEDFLIAKGNGAKKSTAKRLRSGARRSTKLFALA
jgi:DNA-binding protein H-NS